MNNKKWHKYPDEKPTEEGQYLCAYGRYFSVANWVDDLYDFDEYDFYEHKGQKVSGFVGFDSEYGYYETMPKAWQEIDWSDEESVKVIKYIVERIKEQRNEQKNEH